jgi:hypothetical protein
MKVIVKEKWKMQILQTTLEKSEQMEILNVGKQTKFEKNQKEGDKQEKLKVMKIWKKLLQKFSLSFTSVDCNIHCIIIANGLYLEKLCPKKNSGNSDKKKSHENH